MRIDILKADMAEKRLTQEDVAKWIGVSSSSISRKMSGQIKFSSEEISTIAREMGYSPKKTFMVFF